MELKKKMKKFIAYVCVLTLVITGVAGYKTNVTADEGTGTYISIGASRAFGSGEVPFAYIVKSTSDASGRLVADMSIMSEDNKLVLWGADNEIMSIKVPSAAYSGAKIIINGVEAGEVPNAGFELQVNVAKTFNNNAYNTVRIELNGEFYEYQVKVGNPSSSTDETPEVNETPATDETPATNETPAVGNKDDYYAIGASRAFGLGEVPFAYIVKSTSDASGRLVADMSIMSEDNKLVLWGADNEIMSIKVPSADYSGAKIIINEVEAGEVPNAAFELQVNVAKTFNNNAYNIVRIELNGEFYEYEVKVGNPAPVVDETPATDETPSVDETPVTDETPSVDETPATDETPSVDETPATDETPSVDETPATDETPVVDETPSISETPLVDETPNVKETTTKASAAKETTTKVPTAKTPTVKVGRTKVKKAIKKKTAKKAKISLKKISGAKGYVVKISTSKKFKKSKTITKTVKKATFTVKKLKANKKYYVKARAYVIVNGTKKYGKWSKRKAMKLTK